MINLVDDNLPVTLTFPNDEPPSYSADSVFYSLKYVLSVPFTDDQRPKSYTGILHFTMVQDSSLAWIITNWQDIKDENVPSWSELKGRLY